MTIKEIFDRLNTSEELREKFWQAEEKEEQDRVMQEVLNAFPVLDDDLETVTGGHGAPYKWVHYKCTVCSFSERGTYERSVYAIILAPGECPQALCQRA